MKPTRPANVLALVVVAAAVGWLLAGTSYQSLPPLPGAAPVTLGVLTGVLLGIARAIRVRTAGRPDIRPADPMGIARAAALARASSAAAAIFGGFYAGFGIRLLGSLDKSQPSSDARACLFGIVAAVALGAAGLHLERICRVKPPPKDPRIGSAA